MISDSFFLAIAGDGRRFETGQVQVVRILIRVSMEMEDSGPMITVYGGLEGTAKDKTGGGLEGHVPHYSLSLPC